MPALQVLPQLLLAGVLFPGGELVCYADERGLAGSGPGGFVGFGFDPAVVDVFLGLGGDGLGQETVMKQTSSILQGLTISRGPAHPHLAHLELAEQFQHLGVLEFLQVSVQGLQPVRRLSVANEDAQLVELVAGLVVLEGPVGRIGQAVPAFHTVAGPTAQELRVKGMTCLHGKDSNIDNYYHHRLFTISASHKLITLQMQNLVLRLNGQPSLVHRQPRRLVWLRLPDLVPVFKYYTRSNYIETMGNGSLLIIDKNSVTYVTGTTAPLGLAPFKQEILDWEPLGGVCLSTVLVLYDLHTINLYERGQTMRKTWTIEVMQDINSIKASPQEKVIGMTVRQKKNTIFLWNLHDISNKPFQEVTVSEPIVKWEFYSKDMLVILTSREFQVYFPFDGQYNLQFFIDFAHLGIDFCFLDRPKTTQHSGRRTVYPVAILSPKGKLFIYELYDIDKRVKNSIGSITATIEVDQNTCEIKCGYEKENSEVVLCAVAKNGKPYAITLNPQFVPRRRWHFLPQFITLSPENIQYCKDVVCTEDRRPNSQTKLYRLYKLIDKQDFELINSYQCEGFAILGGYNLFCFEEDKLTVYQKSTNFSHESKIVINQLKCPPNIMLLEQKDNIAFFLSEIKLFRLDIQSKVLKPIGFVLRNDKLKLVEVRNQTRSLLYKAGQQYLLLEYQTPDQPGIQKIAIKSIKSSEYPVISLRNGRWAEKRPDKITIGQGNKVLVEFDIAKFIKLLTQQSVLIPYNLFWTTHDGMLLLLRNYIFILQLTQSTEGYSITPVKRFLSYLHVRLNPDLGSIQVMDARSLVIREDAKVMKLGNKIGSLVAENPYELPDTLLRRQLTMRRMYPPHHPKIVQFVMQMGWFDMLACMLEGLYDWLLIKGSMGDLFARIGLEFFRGYKVGTEVKKLQKKQQLDADSESKLKKLCEYILQNPHQLCLQENNPLVLESQVEALISLQQNARVVDFYSSVVLTQFKSFELKGQSFRTMHVAYMVHSINKQEALGLLRQEKPQIDWQWMRKYSIPMWYDNRMQVSKWAEEIGTNLFKVNKEPMDCLFWYTVAGKKNVLGQLFKKYTFNSAEHEAISKFLQRDFSEPKNQTAAVKNAYVLLDKKRYLHALAFFIYGQKIDEAVSLCLKKLKDLNLAYLICVVLEDTVNRTKIIDMMLKQGDIWAKHIAYFYKNQHIDSFNCLFEEDNPQETIHWQLEPKLNGFHPCLQEFACKIETSIPVKRELQQQKLKKMTESNDIFDSFYGNDEPTKVEQAPVQQKTLNPKYNYIKAQSITYFVRNNCPLLALVLDETNPRAKRSYDLCKFLLTKQVNPTVFELIVEMEDYQSIIKAKLFEGKPIKDALQEFTEKLKTAVRKIELSTIYQTQKSRIGQLMHYCFYASRIIKMVASHQDVEPDAQRYLLRNLEPFLYVGELILIVELQVFENFEQFCQHFINYASNPGQKITEQFEAEQFWQLIKSYYDKTSEPKKNKKQNLYDQFEQILYKYRYKKPEIAGETNDFTLSIEQAVPIIIKKLALEHFFSIMQQKAGTPNPQALFCMEKMCSSVGVILSRWSEDKARDQLLRESSMMLAEGVVSKLKLHFLPNYLQNKFQGYCRGLLVLKSKTKKPYQDRDAGRSLKTEKISRSDIVQVFRNRQQPPKCIAINKNQGLGMQLAMLTKRGVRKLEICESLANRTRSQDGSTLVHEDNYQNIDTSFNFNSMHEGNHPAMVGRFLREVLENRKQYDGVGIIKGSTKRTSPEYFKQLDPLPGLDFSEVNCIQCHHFLPLYMLGSKSYIQLCTFDQNRNYNRIRCPNMGEIVKIRSYEQRVTVLDNQNNLASFSFDSKISGNCVYSLKKAGVIDFCPMTPTTYGMITSSSIQVIDSLLHPKRQIVFKTTTNQAPIAVEYYNSTKLAIARRSDLLVYDIRMDVQQQNRDIGGRAKCMVSNYKNRVLVGRLDGRIRVMDVSAQGGEQDYDVKIAGSGRQGESSDRLSVEDLQVMGGLAVALTSEGSVNLFSID